MVKILNSLGYDVLVPKQLCCGMPALLEGDIQRVQSWISRNMGHLIPLVHAGYDIVCSCPTCSFMLRCVIPSGAMYHSEVQEKIRSNTEELMVPLTRRTNRFISVKRSLYEKIMGEDELFPGIPASERLLLANHVFDLGEFLLPSVDFLPSGCTVSASKHHFVYFAPCHQREQKIGRPYVRLLQHMGFEKLQEFPDTMYCCGQGGIMGFKSHYHEISTRIGMRLVEKIKPLNPGIIVTECLSCAIQLSQLTSYRVIHPALLIAACLE
ncbi:MAG: hypothetical protein JRI31_02335 [Deltaproteobacteria bacterium]|nr:hypothetical protein [Deltaproteobacteria bacterium]